MSDYSKKKKKSKKNGYKKKKYELHFTVIKRELERLDFLLANLEDTLIDISNEELQEWGMKRGYDDIIDMYHRLNEPMILAAWLLFPHEYMDYIKHSNIDMIILSLSKLSEITLYGTEYQFFSFPETKHLPSKLFNASRQYKSTATIIEHTFKEKENYETLIDMIDDTLQNIEKYTELNTEVLDSLTIEDIRWISCLMCEFEEILPMVSKISSDKVRNAIIFLLHYCLDNHLDEIANLIGLYLEFDENE